jgi:acyl-CoA synthetase (AMP-forming)/AMP-acid ligase II
MFHILSNAGVVITADDRTPENISKLVEKHRIELLPASPTFLKLLLLSGAYSSYDMRSLKMISYGTEPMPESTLKMLKNIFPDVKLLQTYGLIELGVLRSKSEKDDSLWVKVGGDGYDGLLEIKAKSAMLGYLNAQSPFTEDGWFKTGDAVESKGDYIKILGRRSELINVGGEKVYPQEVESVIQEMDGVVDVTVYGEQNSILGSIVCAKVVLLGDAKRGDFSNEVKQFCSGRMKKFMIPIKVEISDEKLHGSRFKKNRAVANNNA